MPSELSKMFAELKLGGSKKSKAKPKPKPKPKPKAKPKKNMRGGGDIVLASDIEYIANTSNLNRTGDIIVQANDPSIAGAIGAPTPFSGGLIQNQYSVVQGIPRSTAGAFDLPLLSGGGKKKPRKTPKKRVKAKK